MEVKKNGKWESAVPFVDYIDKYDIENTNRRDVPRYNTLYHDRNYGVFAILAGVRVPWMWKTEVFQKYPTKGFPEDASDDVKNAYERYGSDAHTPSYLSLTDLNSVDWDKETIPTFFDVTPDQKQIYDYVLKKFKDRYGKFVQGAWILEKPFVIDYFTYNAIKEPWTCIYETLDDYLNKSQQNKRPLSEVFAFVPIGYIFEDFKHQVINKLRDESVNNDDIRIVFWFDN